MTRISCRKTYFLVILANPSAGFFNLGMKIEICYIGCRRVSSRQEMQRHDQSLPVCPRKKVCLEPKSKSVVKIWEEISQTWLHCQFAEPTA